MAHFKDLQFSTPKATHPCIRKGCGKAASNSLAINYLNKKGWFCDECKTELMKEGLVIENKSAVVRSHSSTDKPVPQPVTSSGDQKSRVFSREN